MNGSGSRLVQVRALVEDESPAVDDKPAVVGRMQRLCRAAARALPATGVGISLIAETGTQATVAASGETTEQIEELQFALGEGPCLDAYATRPAGAELGPLGGGRSLAGLCAGGAGARCTRRLRLPAPGRRCADGRDGRPTGTRSGACLGESSRAGLHVRPGCDLAVCSTPQGGGRGPPGRGSCAMPWTTTTSCSRRRAWSWSSSASTWPRLVRIRAHAYARTVASTTLPRDIVAGRSSSNRTDHRCIVTANAPSPVRKECHDHRSS